MIILSLFYGILPIKGLSTTTLALEPESLELPLFDTAQGSIFELELKVSNIQNLKEFHLEFGYDKNYLQYLGGGIDSTFYLTARGWTGADLDGILGDVYSGTGVIFRYWFKPLKTGNTQISLINVRFLDENGSPIFIDTSGCTVKVLSKEDYIDGEYAAMANNYVILSTLLNNTIITTKRLESLYNSTIKDYDDLNILYEQLNTNFLLLEKNYDVQQSNFNSLQIINEKMKSDLDNQTRLTYVFIAATFVLFVFTIFFAIRKRS